MASRHNFWFFPPLLQGHKRAPSDASVASSEDEKIPLSPSVLEPVPEKGEPILPVSTPTEAPVVRVLDSSLVEQPAAPAPEERTEEASNTAEEKPVEKMLPEEEDVTPSEPATEPDAPAKEVQQLEIAVEDEKEVDTAELPANEEASTETTEVTAAVEEPNTPVKEDGYKHLKVILTLPEQNTVSPKEENEKEPTDKDKINTEDEKKVPDKAKDDRERDLDSGSGSAADNSSVDLNLSISSFLSKTKEPGSVSVQVT